MIRKEDIMCIEKTGSGPFWEEFLVFIEVRKRVGGLYHLRVMKKKKIIDYGECDMIQNEYYIRSRIRHPFLINTICGFQDYEHLFLVSEQSQNYLANLISSEGRFSAKVSRFYMAEILLAIQYLHSKGFTYGFLSPKNMMIGDDGHIKLKYDFLNGIDCVVGDFEENIEYASIDYANSGEFGPVSDYWSMGIILYHMLGGITPFAAPGMDSVITRIKTNRIRFPEFFDEHARNLISKLLVTSPRDRLGYMEEDAEMIRKHPFFEGISWVDVLEKKIKPPFLFNVTKKECTSRSANLRILYTTDYLPDQKDGYGQTFRGYGSIYSPDIHRKIWRYGYI
ncbi:ribosomal protein S6 kinase [Encephalitozoon romaleae SJ-2008]|uniref:Ribosomal protein S6 kinase n=1 Tax=Encephalitozoon romaleae (strain SJ-2008) TaxID=1178016 RepID=I7AGG6_ENCRO|nr:ribosomal protein S6 kinase [Encephalitozoon romaleae SJ-2008]AFN83860.1 ribosomal protein S6 kinase [Encephalitozoon romaleae SJ-2008]